MYSAYSSLRNILLDDYDVSSTVTASNIMVGYRRQINEFPCITIHRVGGDSKGKLGSKTSTWGSRERTENKLMQVDVFNTNSIEDLELLDDKVIKAIFSGSSTGEAYSLVSNPSRFDDSYDAYRTTQTWLLSEVVSD